MRNKLIELIKESVDGCSSYWAGRIADHLLSNWDKLSQELVQEKWIPVKERLPDEEWQKYTDEKDYDVYPLLAVVSYKRGGQYVTKLFYTGENFVDDEFVNYTHSVTHWMPLPKGPKEE